MWSLRSHFGGPRWRSTICGSPPDPRPALAGVVGKGPDASVLSATGRRGPLRGLACQAREVRNDGSGGVVDVTMTTWGFIGSGNIGTTVARLAVAAGHDVVLSNSRGPQTLAGVVDDLGPQATAATAAEAARDGDVVVVTIPLGNYPQVPPHELRAKIVIDTMNYYPQRDGHIAALDAQTTTSSELLQAHLPASHVVKGFNNIFFQHLRDLSRPAGSPDRSALAIAGDDVEAKGRVIELLDQIGYDAVDLGALSEGWRIQPETVAYGLMYAADEQDWTAGARAADAGQVTRRAAQAQRTTSA